jgi:hypothetical protein
MMHRTAREHTDHSGFHMVVGSAPVGYCGTHAPHPTEVEARECFSRFQRDHVARSGTSSWSNCMVKGCKQPANQTWQIEGDGYSLAVLCDEHSDKEHAIAAMHLEGPAGDSWFS